MLLDLEKKIEGLILFLSSDSQFIDEGSVTQVDPRTMRIRLKPGQRNESRRRMFLVGGLHQGRTGPPRCLVPSRWESASRTLSGRRLYSAAPARKMSN